MTTHTTQRSRETRLRERIDVLTDERDDARAELQAMRRKLKTTRAALVAARRTRDTAKEQVKYVRDLERRRARYGRKVSSEAAA